MNKQQRDFVGYANKPPESNWPNAARIAVNFVINYEAGAEANILEGDPFSEAYLTENPRLAPRKAQRHLSSEAFFEYGSRVGIWRLLNLFAEYNVPLTLFMCGLALQRNLDLASYLATTQHEIAGHGYRWLNYHTIPIDVERKHIKTTLAIIEQLTEYRPQGWYTGRVSPNTRKLIAAEKLLYDSDNYADDLPFWQQVAGQAQLIIPYTFDCNDCKYYLAPGFTTSHDFYQYLVDTFICLYREGEYKPKMMTVALHERISGRPGRSEAIRRFLDYIYQHERVWLCRRIDIAQHWHQQYPQSGH